MFQLRHQLFILINQKRIPHFSRYLMFNARHERLKHWVSGCYFLYSMTLSTYKGLEVSSQVSPEKCFTAWYGQ